VDALFLAEFSPDNLVFLSSFSPQPLFFCNEDPIKFGQEIKGGSSLRVSFLPALRSFPLLVFTFQPLPDVFGEECFCVAEKNEVVAERSILASLSFLASSSLSSLQRKVLPGSSSGRCPSP